MGFMQDSLAGKIALIAIAVIIIGGVIAGFIFLLSSGSGRNFFNSGFSGVFNSILGFIEAPFIGIVNAIKSAIQALISDITGGISNIGHSITSGASSIGSSLYSNTIGRL